MLKYILISFILITSCAHKHRSKYQPHKKHEGYREMTENGLSIANFQGNSSTKEGDAMLFAKFRAIELCEAEKKKLTLILDVVNKTQKKDILRSRGDTYYPSYYYGMAPYYSRYSSIGIYGGFGSTNTETWSETVITPEFDVLYQCLDKAYGPEVIFRDVSPEEMKILVKDLKGGLQVEKVLEDSANKGVLEYGDVIIKAQGQRIQKHFELLRTFNETKPPLSVKLDIYREGDKKSVQLRSQDISASVLKAQSEIITAACGFKEIGEREICRQR